MVLRLRAARLIQVIVLLGTRVALVVFRVSPVHAKVCWNVLIIVVVDDVVLVLANDVHSGEDVECVIHSALHILKVDFLTNLCHDNKDTPNQISHHEKRIKYLGVRQADNPSKTYIAELFVHFEDLIGDLGAGHHRSLAYFLQHASREEDKLLVLFLLVV